MPKNQENKYMTNKTSHNGSRQGKTGATAPSL